MDFVAWCESVLAAVREKIRADQQTSIIGANVEDLLQTVLPPAVAEHPNLWDTQERLAVYHALQGMEALGLVEPRSQHYYRITQQGREHLNNPLPLWTQICAIGLEDDYAAVLRAVNRLSITLTEEGAFWLKQVDQDQLFAELGWDSANFERLYAAVVELKRLGMLWEMGAAGRQIHARSTYLSSVWDLRKGETLEAALIDKLRADGETTSVDFKRELHLNSDNEKAEFVKDVLGLATTKVSGRRWLIIGFADKTMEFHAPPGYDITQNRIEQILQVYAQPQILVRYEVVQYRGNQVGKLEIFSDRTQVPYRVAKSIGNKKRIEEGEIFVRHGSQTEHPTPAELEELEAEAERARARHADES